MPRHGQKQGAFVLLEMAAAIALLTGTVFLALVFFRTEVREVRNTHERLAALLLVESEIERLRTLPYAEIAVGAKRPLELQLPSAKRLKQAQGTLTVKEIKLGLKMATVRIGWRSRKGMPRHVEMTAEFSREGQKP